MRHDLSISNRIVATIMAFVIPFCCCSLDLCADTQDASRGCGSCCERPESDESSNDTTDSSCNGCFGCTKAPINPGPQLDTFALSLEPIAYPLQTCVRIEILVGHHSCLHCKELEEPPEDNPCLSARRLRSTLTLQV